MKNILVMLMIFLRMSFLRVTHSLFLGRKIGSISLREGGTIKAYGKNIYHVVNFGKSKLLIFIKRLSSVYDKNGNKISNLQSAYSKIHYFPVKEKYKILIPPQLMK